jgi:multiple sugar transport system permease protein
MAFMDVMILGGSKWVGLDNFIYVAARPLFWMAWKNTVVFVLLSLGMGFFAPVLLALLLSEVPRGKTLFRTLYYLPALTVGVVTLILWMQFYDPTEQGFANQVVMNIGSVLNLLHVHYLLNALAFIGNVFAAPVNAVAHIFGGGGIGYIHYLKGINIGPLQWLQDPKMAMAATILPSVWAGMGPGCIIYLAALKAVPEELYYAADLDGAGLIQKVRTVTLPTIFPLVLINLLGAFIGAFHGAGNILVMTGGGPDHATHVMSLEIFYEAYIIAKYGYATAIAWMLASVLIGFTVLQMKIFSRMKFSTAEQKEN